MAVDAGSAVGYLDLDISGFLAGLRNADEAAGKSSKTIAAKIGGHLSSAGESLTKAGTALTKGITVPVIGAGAAIVNMSTKFESAMSRVQAISGASGKDLIALTNKAKELGATTEWSASEVADGMTEMAKAGWSTKQIIDGMAGVLNAASASGENLASVSTIVADAITGFGLEAKDATKLADLLTYAANAGTVDITDLGESFKYISPVANAMGLSVEEVTTAISAMSTAGIKGSQAGTSLKNLLTNLVNPVGQAKDAISELGLSAINSDGSMKSMNEIVGELRNSLGGLTDSEKARYASMLAGKEGMSGLLALLNLTEKEYNALSESMENCNGVAKETADTMLNNLSGQIIKLKSALEGLAIQFGEVILPHLKNFVKWVQNLVQKFSELSPKQKEQIVKWAAIAAAIGPVILITGKLISAIGGIVTAFSKVPGILKIVKTDFGLLKTALAGVSAPVWATIAAIAVLTAAFATLWKTNEEFRDKITAIWEQVKGTFDQLTSGIVERLNKLGFDFESIGEVLKATWQGFCDFLAPVFEGAFNIIATVFQTAVDIFFGIWDFWHSVFTGDWQGAWDAVEGIFTSVWNGIVGFFSAIGNTFLGILDTICGWFGTTWSSTWNSISSFFINIWNSITSFLSSAWETIKNVVQVGIMFIGQIISAAWNIITLPFRFIWENCKETIISVWNSIVAFLGPILNSIASFFSTVWNGIKTAVTTAVNSVKTVITNVFNAVKTFVSSVWNDIKEKISGPIENARSKVASVVDSIKSKFSSGFTAAKSTVSSIFESIKSKITSTIENARDKVRSAIEKIKGFFNFSWSLPKLKLPHISITGSFSLNPPSVPTFGISWYNKAMGSGMILNGATIFGMDKNGKLLGGGESGSETVVGTGSLLSMIRQTVNDAIKPIIKATYEIIRASAELGYVTYNGFMKQSQMFERVAMAGGPQNNGGDTFNFYSPKAINEIEAAKQMKKAKRELAEGF